MPLILTLTLGFATSLVLKSEVLMSVEFNDIQESDRF